MYKRKRAHGRTAVTVTPPASGLLQSGSRCAKTAWHASIQHEQRARGAWAMVHHGVAQISAERGLLYEFGLSRISFFIPHLILDLMSVKRTA